MERPRALARRTCALLIAVSAGAFLGVACTPEMEKLSKERSPRDSIGQEIYKVLCRRVAGMEMPEDIEGVKSQTLCLGDRESAEAELAARREELPARLVALADRRGVIADALDESFPGDSASGLEDLMSQLLPYYDAPGEEAQEGTRRMAAVLRALAGDDVALAGMERFAREGMTSSEGDFGIMRAVLSERAISSFLSTVLPALTEDSETAKQLRDALSGMALELATNELQTDPSSNTCRSRDLMMRTEPSSAQEPAQFGSGKPLFVPLRDVRGMPIPKRASDAGSRDVLSACGTGKGEVRPVPFPFVDADRDGFADVDGPNFSVDPSFSGPLPEPYAVTGEAPGAVARDAYGRAYALNGDGSADASKQLYLTQDADSTVLAATLREAGRMFDSKHATLSGLAGAVPALVGDEIETVRRYEKATHTFQAADPAHSPLLGLMHASSATTEDPSYDESLELSLKLLREQEPAVVASFEPLLALERRTRPGNDAYPDAKLEPNNTFWEELTWEIEKLSRRRLGKTGESLLEAAVRASLGYGRNFDKPDAPFETLIDPRLLAQQGSLLAMMMRYKDEWRGNPTPASKRTPGDPAIIGSLKQPVDRSMPETPITCGRDGCGGLVVGSPFERWKQPGQTCMIQIPGRSSQGKDCGAPANQSLFHRSLAMLAELEGRAQCNKPITVRDLFDFAAGDDATDDPELENTIRQAEEALAKDYTCPASAPADAPCRAYADKFPAAFVPRSDELGPLPVAIQECALLDLKDAGRTFGQVMTHQYQLEIPNPWVRRYLEDVARAADTSLPACPPQLIVDPTKAPPCIPDAAKLSRGVFEELVSCGPADPDCVDTLGELIEFLLDDKSLFQSDRDLAELRPDPRTLSRVMFTPAGASEGFQLFYPLLMRGAPDICKANDTRPKCDASDPSKDATCCIKEIENPPMRFRVDTFFSATTYAWEHTFKLKSGQELSFLDATRPVADAFNRFDMPPRADPALYEDQGYVLTKLGAIVASHYDSPRNTSAQNVDPSRAGYSKLTGLVRYEEMLADLFDDGGIDLAQKAPHGERMFDPKTSFTADQQLGMLAKGTDLLLALDALPFRGEGNANDGIASLARTTEVMVNPHAFCAGPGGDARVIDGAGACDSASRARKPIAALNGRDYPCWDDGRCFDGKSASTPRRYVSSLSLMLDAAGDLRNRADREAGVWDAVRSAMAGALDAFAPIQNGRFARRRVRSLALVMGDYMRERWAQEKAAGTLSTYGKRNTDDAIDMLTNPGVAGGLRTLHALWAQEGILDAVSQLLFAMLDESSEPAASRAFLASAADAVQLLPGDAGSNAVLRNVAAGLAANLEDVLSGKSKLLDVDGSLAWNNIFMLGVTAKADPDDVLGTILGAMMRARGENYGKLGTTPGSDLVDSLLDINRVDPAESGQHRARDYRSAFTRIADVMLDKRTGFERLYSLVRCSRNPHDPSCD